MSKKVTLIYGDGIGPEVIGAAMRVLEGAGLTIDWDVKTAGSEAISDYGRPLPDQVIASIKKNKIALKGPLTTAVAEGFSSANVGLQKEMDLYANLRPVKNVPGVDSPFSQVDLVVIRENTEDLYAGIEHTVAIGVTQSLKVITERASKRIARFAFEYAKKKGRHKVSAAHKANILKVSDRLFLETCRAVAKGFPEIEYEEIIIDNLAMQLTMRPERFELLLLTNMYGDIISDLCAGLVGGLGLVPGANLGKRCAVFESVHGSAPDIAGKNCANPIAAILSALMMLRHLDLNQDADRIEQALFAVTAAGKVLTPDLGGAATTTQMTEEIIARLD